MAAKNPNFASEDERGMFAEVAKGNWKTLNYAYRKKGSLIGNHYHKRFSELIFLVSGKARVKLVDINTGKEDEFILLEKMYFIVEPFKAHALEIIEDSEMIMLLSEEFDQDNTDLNPYSVL